MTAISCTRRLTFCAAHRVMGHESKCAHLHGHNYVVYATAESPYHEDGVDSLGRVIDLSVIKERLGGWLQNKWDHGAIFNVEDHMLINFASEARFKLYAMKTNPTAENMARHLLNEVCPMLFQDTRIIITSITVEETEKCSAKAELEAE